MEDDPLVTLRQEGPMKEETGRWQVRKSKLVQHSGFFRRMFSRDCIVSLARTVGRCQKLIDAIGDEVESSDAPRLHQWSIRIFGGLHRARPIH